jgi:DNA-binding XRE family transcriptional regulator
MSKDNYRKRFAENLQALRKYKKLTKTQAAAELGIHRETYAAYEDGQRVPSFAATVSISEFFHVNLSDMLQKDTEEILAGKKFYDTLKNDEKAFLYNYRRLSPFSKGRLVEYALSLYMKENGKKF